ncbi:hypothetical protein ONZ45_g2690 [Pleurotus djamor]|nr:hypothetical protein ONZ45_g2690 [Pleurotus djamor]
MSNVRRSERLKRVAEAPPPQVNDPDSQDEEEADDDTQYKPKPVKRRKVARVDGETKRVVPRGKGKLRNLPQMPLDILFEIFGFLTPLDVLRLARTTKDFRSVLMKRSAISLWKTVFDNVPGTPEKPEDICEPAWANFLFTNHCYQCFSPRPSHTFGGHYVRFCKRCATDKEFDVRTSEVSQKLLRLGISPYDSPCRVYSIAYEYEGTYAWSSKHYSSRSRLSYLRVDLDDFLEGYERVRQNEEERKAFLEQRKERFRLIDQRIPVYKKWFTEKHDERSAERDDIRAARFEAIQQKLSDLGWASELKTLGPSDMDTLRQLPNVKVPRPLTNRMWNKIEPEIVPLMEGFRDERLKKERAAVLKRRRQIFADVVKDYNSSQPPDSILPCPSDLYFLESFAPVKTSIEEDPNEVKYSASNFDDVIAEMPRYCEEWKALCASQLIEFANNDASVKNADPPITFDESTLQLARTVFTCTYCDQAIVYPNMLGHRCFHREPRLYDPRATQAMLDLKCHYWAQSARPLLRLIPAAMISKLLQTCGFDPQTATKEDVDAGRRWVTAERNYVTPTVMRWRRAIQFASWFTPDVGSCILVTDESLIKVYDLAELDYYETKSRNSPFICVHCSEKTVGSLTEHMTKIYVPRLRTAAQLVYVCKYWEKIVTPFLYETLMISTASQLRLATETLSLVIDRSGSDFHLGDDQESRPSTVQHHISQAEPDPLIKAISLAHNTLEVLSVPNAYTFQHHASKSSSSLASLFKKMPALRAFRHDFPFVANASSASSIPPNVEFLSVSSNHPCPPIPPSVKEMVILCYGSPLHHNVHNVDGAFVTTLTLLCFFRPEMLQQAMSCISPSVKVLSLHIRSWTNLRRITSIPENVTCLGLKANARLAGDLRLALASFFESVKAPALNTVRLLHWDDGYYLRTCRPDALSTLVLILRARDVDLIDWEGVLMK